MGDTDGLDGVVPTQHFAWAYSRHNATFAATGLLIERALAEVLGSGWVGLTSLDAWGLQNVVQQKCMDASHNGGDPAVAAAGKRRALAADFDLRPTGFEGSGGGAGHGVGLVWGVIGAHVGLVVGMVCVCACVCVCLRVCACEAQVLGMYVLACRPPVGCPKLSAIMPSSSRQTLSNRRLQHRQRQSALKRPKLKLMQRTELQQHRMLRNTQHWLREKMGPEMARPKSKLRTRVEFDKMTPLPTRTIAHAVRS